MDSSKFGSGYQAATVLGIPDFLVVHNGLKFQRFKWQCHCT